MICDECGGSGNDGSEDELNCPACKGRGEKSHFVKDAIGILIGLGLVFFAATSQAAIGTTPIQCQSAQSASATSLPVSITTTAGNLLIATTAVYNQNQNGGVYTMSLDAGVTEEYVLTAGGGFRAGGAGGWAVAAGGAESFTATISVDVGQWRHEVCEYAADNTPQVYASASDITNENTLTQSAPSGTATDTDAGVVFYLFHLNNNGQAWQAGRAYTNGTESVAPANENRPVTAIATEVVGGTSTSRSSIFSTTSVGGRNVGGIMIARETVSAGVSFDKETYVPGETIAATAAPATFASPMTTATEQAGGDTISAEAGATDENADFILCGPSGFQTAAACNNTQIGKVLTYDVTDGTSTASDTLTIQVSSSDSFGQMACDPGNAVSNICDADSLFNDIPATYDLGDEYYAHVTQGTCIVNDYGVAACSQVPATIELRLYDVLLGVWGDMVEFNISESVTLCPKDVIKDPFSSPIFGPTDLVICP